MPIYTGKTADGSDMHNALGLFINPENEDEWSNIPYNKEQRQIVKNHRTYVEVVEYMSKKLCSLDDCYNQIKNKTFGLSARCKRFVLSHYDEEGNFIENLNNI